jgi:D-alanine transaminase
MKIYFNGNYCESYEARVSIMDRGYIFGDGIYEAFLVKNERFIDFEPHIKRLKRSLEIVNISMPEVDKIESITTNLLKLNSMKSALMYVQVTRGEFPTREHGMPYSNTPSVVIIAYPEREIKREWIENGISCMLAQDIRWTRRDIKSLNLLGNVMLKQKSADCGFDDVIFFEKDSNFVTEASSSNVIIIKDEKLLTHPANNYILNGITKNRTMQIAKDIGIEVVEKEFIVDDLFLASSILLTSSGYRIRCCTNVDGVKINNGRICRIGRLLYNSMEKFVDGNL